MKHQRERIITLDYLPKQIELGVKGKLGERITEAGYIT